MANKVTGPLNPEQYRKIEQARVTVLAAVEFAVPGDVKATHRIPLGLGLICSQRHLGLSGLQRQRRRQQRRQQRRTTNDDDNNHDIKKNPKTTTTTTRATTASTRATTTTTTTTTATTRTTTTTTKTTTRKESALVQLYTDNHSLAWSSDKEHGRQVERGIQP